MIEFIEVGFGYPDKELFENVSFEISDGEHAVLIGSNGCGKSSLLQLMMNEERYTYEGRIVADKGSRFGYVSQFVEHRTSGMSVIEFLSAPFIEMLDASDKAAARLSEAADADEAYADFQLTLDRIEAADAYNFESNIGKQLSTAGLSKLADSSVDCVSGGEYKLLCIMRAMLLKPQLLIMDEPDVFLDFENLIGLMKLINAYDGTLLAVTHSRLLLSQCFDKVLHLEGMQMQEYPGCYEEYSRWLLESKLELFEAAKEYDDYMTAQQKLLAKLQKRAEINSDPKLGRRIQARKKLIGRIRDLRGSDPFIDLPEHCFTLPEVSGLYRGEGDGEVLLEVRNHSICFDRPVLSDVSFTIKRGDRIAIAGPNGSGKTSLIKDIYEMLADSGHGDETAYFEQVTENEDECLSGGEKSLAQIEKICRSGASILLLDEPTSHLDIHAQRALERALREYKGTVILISHDFYTVTGCAERILLLENGEMREMSGRAYRKSIYKNYFGSDIFESERSRVDLERQIGKLLTSGKLKEARELLEAAKA